MFREQLGRGLGASGRTTNDAIDRCMSQQEVRSHGRDIFGATRTEWPLEIFQIRICPAGLSMAQQKKRFHQVVMCSVLAQGMGADCTYR